VAFQALVLGGAELPLILTDSSLLGNSIPGHNADPRERNSGKEQLCSLSLQIWPMPPNGIIERVVES
jgi:hypothetical protein